MEDVNLDDLHGPGVDDVNLGVKITDAYKAYNSNAVILNGLNMNVKKRTM